MSTLDARYGRTATGTRRVPRWVLVAVLVGGVGTSWLGWAAWGASHHPVTARLTGYEVVSTSQVDVRLEVFRRDGVGVHCEVYAQAYDHGIVGEGSVDLPAGADGTTVLTTVITTERPAVNGVLRGCQPAAGS